MSGFSLLIPDYEMLPFQIDGGNHVELTTPVSSVGILYPGERIDLVVENTASASLLTIVLDDEYITPCITYQQH
jgi:hypothetical protein